MRKNLLLAEDHANLRELVQDYLSASGFEVDAAGDGLEAWQAVQSRDYDMILLDVMMPGMDGFELCRKIRESENVPILFLTARVQEQDQLYGYELGADDYIVKPFSLPVLLAKCRVILERNGRVGTGGDWLEAGEIRLQLSRKMVFCGEKPVTLQALDFELLQYFMKNPGRVLSREQILMKVWGHDYEGSEAAGYAITMCIDNRYLTLHSSNFTGSVLKMLIFCQGLALLLIGMVQYFQKKEREVKKMRDLFLNAIAHEMKTPVECDIRLMEMVIDNFVSNAVKNCRDGGVIRIRTEKNGIRIFNEGEDIPPECAKHIWEPLYKVDKSRTETKKCGCMDPETASRAAETSARFIGNGMGLAVREAILKLHGAEYGMENVPGGVEFYFRFARRSEHIF